MILADSHVHLDFPDFAQDLDAVVHRARAGGVDHFNLIGTRLANADRLRALRDRIEGAITTIGVHPHYAAELPVSRQAIQEAVAGAGATAVGETGLDFHYDFSPREAQEAVFRHHIQAAHALALPLVIHTRQAEERTMAILDQEGIPEAGGVLHCFTGTLEMANWALDRGLHLSFSGVLTFRNAEDLRRIAREMPLNRLLLETDAPYLAPMPHRGKRNEPSFLPRTADALARAMNQPLMTVAQATTQNYLSLFRVAGREVVGAKGVLAYPIGDALYLNVSRGCTLRCGFCPKWQAPTVHHYDLSLTANPSAAELIQAVGDAGPWREVVFCGFGEPTLRLEVILEVARWIKGHGGQRVRLNTDGLANLVHRRDVTPAFSGLIDAVSVSLNAPDEATYNKHCHPSLEGAWSGLLAFIQAVRAHVPEVTATAIDGLPGVDIAACRALASTLGVGFRPRKLDRVG